MDNPTRIGLGGTALAALIAAPFVPWWISYPLIGCCLIVSAWGLWPLIPAAARFRLPGMLPTSIPIWQAVEHVRKAINDTNSKECYPTTLGAIRQAALDGKIKLRGRREIDRGGSQAFSDVSSDIPAEYWKVSTLEPMTTTEHGVGGYPHTNPETVYAWGPKGIYEKNRYADLTVDMREVKRLWP